MPRSRRQEFPDFKHLAGQSGRFFKQLPRLAGNTALNYFKDSWDREAWLDHRIERWESRKHNKGSRRRILVKTGRLRRSLRMQHTANRIIISTDVPYAQIHNEGGLVNTVVKVRSHKRKRGRITYTVRAHSRKVNFTIPKRQFMGHSHTLDRRIILLIEQALNQIYG